MKSLRNLKGSRLQSDLKASGVFYRKHSSKEEEGEITINKNAATICSAQDIICRDVGIVSIQGSKNIYLENGFMFTLSVAISSEDEVFFLDKYQQKIRWLEKFSVTRALVLSAVLLTGIFVLRFVITNSVTAIVAMFPYKWEEQIGKNTYTSFSTFAFDESNLPNERIGEILTQANAIIAANGLRDTEIYFHESNLVGPNALAFPGGPIVVTDDLLNLLESDDLILAVIAHELAHIEMRHSLNQIIEVVGVAALASVLLGSTDSLIEEASLVAVNLFASANSRNFEKEADLVALTYLEKANLEPDTFANAIRKLTQYTCEMGTSDSIDDCFDDTKTGWFSTHPSGAARIQYLTSD